MDRGKTLQAVAATLSVDYNTVANWRDNYHEHGLQCLVDKPRSGRPIVIDGQQRAKITALACSQAPAGHARWGLRLLADKVVELGYCESVSHTQVGHILKKRVKTASQADLVHRRNSTPSSWRRWNGSYGCMHCPTIRNTRLSALMSAPCFLIGDVVAPLTLQPGRIGKEHYAYEKLGSCALLASIEPLTGQRLALVLPQRTKKEYTQFCQALAAAYPTAIKIRLVQDNLNTHNASSFYEHLPAEEAFALAQRFEFYYTPKSASWLNMIEIEFSALSRACLDRRIPTL